MVKLIILSDSENSRGLYIACLLFTCNSSGQLVGSLDGGFLVVDVEVNHVYVSIAVEGGGGRGRGTLDTTFCKVKLSEYPSSAREATDL